MKQLVGLGIVSGLFFSGSAFSLEPIQGWYVGLNAAVTGGPGNSTGVFTITSINQILYPGTTQTGPGTINNNIIGGGIGADVGYRLGQFRIEGEVYYNYTSIRTLTFGNYTLESPNIVTPTCNILNCPSTAVSALSLGFNGTNGVTLAMANFYYEWIPYNSQSDNPIVPYLGLGIGGARVQRGINFQTSVDSGIGTSLGGNVISNVPAGQIIVGASYFMDDYAWFQVDYRFTATGNIKAAALTQKNNTFSYAAALNSETYYLNALMFTFNFSFDNASLNGTNS